ARRIVVVLGERTAAGARWSSRLRAFSDRVTLLLVRQAVDATLASEMLLRAVTPAPAPVAAPLIEYVQVQSGPIGEPLTPHSVATVQEVAMAPDLQPGDLLYTVQPGDNLSSIAERFYGDPAEVMRIAEATLAPAQPC